MAVRAARRRIAATGFSTLARPRIDAAVLSPQAQYILSILQAGSKASTIRTALGAWPCRLTPRIVKEVLHSLADGKHAATFFDWAAAQQGFKHDALTKCELLLSLLRTGRHRDAYAHAALLGCVPNRFIFQTLIAAFAISSSDAQTACELLWEMKHNHIAPNVKVLNSILRDLLHLRIDDGVLFFRELVHLRYANVYSYTLVVQGLCDHTRLLEAEQLVLDMELKGDQHYVLPNDFTYRSLLNGFCKEGDLDKAFRIVSKMIEKGYEPGIIGYNMLLHGLCTVNRFKEAQQLMKHMIEKGYALDKVSYTTIIDAISRKFPAEEVNHSGGEANHGSGAAYYFREMLTSGCEPDIVTYTSMIHGLYKYGKWSKAWLLLDDMLERGCKPNSITCNAIVDGLCKSNRVDMGHRAMLEMMSSWGFVPDEITFNSLIDGYGKCGRLKDAETMFRTMAAKGLTPCNATYSSLMAAMCRKGKAHRAWRLLQEMKPSVAPDAITYSVLVSGLGKVGKVDMAVAMVEEMNRNSKEECKPTVITYNSLVDGLCNVGRLREAFQVLDEMERKGCCPNLVSFNTIVAGLVQWRRVDEAVRLVREMSSWGGFSPNDVTIATLVHGLCCEARIQEACELMKNRGSPCAAGGAPFAAVVAGLRKAGLWMEARAMADETLAMEDARVLEGRIDETGGGIAFAAMVQSLCNGGMVERALELMVREVELGRTPGRVAFEAMARGLYGATSVSKARRLLNEISF